MGDRGGKKDKNKSQKQKKSKKDQKVNPIYLGFAKCVIDCFNLELMIPKDTRKNRSLQKKPKFQSKEEIDIIISKSSYRTGLLVQLFFETGLRLKELFNAKREDINLDKRTISGIGKGNKDFEEKFSKNMAQPKAGWPLFDGDTFTGWSVQPLVKGKTVMKDGEITRGGPDRVTAHRGKGPN